MNINVRILRRWLNPLRRLPVHPQWLVFKNGGDRFRLLAFATGATLDIGCADKVAAHYLPAACRYIGLDHYQTATTRYETLPDVYGDACSLPLADASIDTVLLLEVLEHIPNPGAALNEIRRIVRPNGVLILSMPFLYPIHDAPYDFQRFTRFGLVQHLESEGFKIKLIQSRLDSFEVAGLLMSLALADAARLILETQRWAAPIVPVLAVLIVLSNICSWILSKTLPATEFMPGGYEVVAIRTP